MREIVRKRDRKCPTLLRILRCSELHSDKQFRMREYRGKSPVVLVLGSYTCPNFRSAATALDELYSRYGKQTPFVLIYIREAHTDENWQSTRNQREGVNMAVAKTMEEKQEHAVMCTRKLKMKFPAVVDGLDGKVEAAYAAWPSRAFVVGRNGDIVNSTRLTELDFRAVEMEAAINKALSPVQSSKLP